MRALTVELGRELGRTVQRVEVPALDVFVCVRALAAADVVTLGRLNEGEDANRMLVAMSVCDEDGVPLFQDAWEQGADEVAAWPAALFVPVLNAALALNDLGEPAGNSDGIPG